MFQKEQYQVMTDGDVSMHQCQKPLKYPFSQVGLITTQYFRNSANRLINNQAFGSGFLITSTFVVTVAHAVYNIDKLNNIISPPQKITFKINNKQYQVKKKGFYIPKNQKNPKSDENFFRIQTLQNQNNIHTPNNFLDFALLQLQQQVQLNQKIQFPTFHFIDTKLSQQTRIILNTQVIVIGIPQIKNKKNQQVYFSANKILQVQYPSEQIKFKRIIHNCTTNVGVSGGPMFCKGLNDKYFFIGIHNIGVKQNKTNKAITFGPEIKTILFTRLKETCLKIYQSENDFCFFEKKEVGKIQTELKKIQTSKNLIQFFQKDGKRVNPQLPMLLNQVNEQKMVQLFQQYEKQNQINQHIKILFKKLTQQKIRSIINKQQLKKLLENDWSQINQNIPEMFKEIIKQKLEEQFRKKLQEKYGWKLKLMNNPKMTLFFIITLIITYPIYCKFFKKGK